MTDQEIIKEVRSGNNEKPIKYLYQEFPKIKQLVLNGGGSKLLAEEIFNDSLVLLLEKLRDPNFELTSKLTTYLYGINRFLLLNQLRKEGKSVSLEWKDTLILSQDDFGYDYEKEEKLTLLEKVLDSISDKCKSIFKLFYFQNKSMKTIAKELNYSSVNSAKTQKYKCVERASYLAEEMLNQSTKTA